MQELINSLVRLSAATTVYTIQQLQTAAGSADPADSVQRLCQIIDSMTTALTGQIDAARKPTVDSISSMGSNMVGKTLEVLNPSELLHATNDAIRKTTGSVANMIRTGEKKVAAETEAAEAAKPTAA
jgi:hypothetical protein